MEAVSIDPGIREGKVACRRIVAQGKNVPSHQESEDFAFAGKSGEKCRLKYYGCGKFGPSVSISLNLDCVKGRVGTKRKRSL